MTRIRILTTFIFQFWFAQSAIAQDSQLVIVKTFAENYSPNTEPNIGVPQLINVPDSIVIAFQSLRQTNKKDLEKYLTLIFVKLYSAHMQCCHQSYELRTLPTNPAIDPKTDPLIYEFNLITKYFNIDKPIEFISSSIGYEWVKKHKYLLSDKNIKREVDKIKSIEQDIKKGVYWKE